jgi:hypothetical protein
LSQKHDRAWRKDAPAWKEAAWLLRNPQLQQRLERATAEQDADDEPDQPFHVAALGPVGHVYFTEPKTDDQRRALAKRLVLEGRIPSVLLRTSDGQALWFHARGETRVPDEVAAVLPHPPPLREQIARDLDHFLTTPDVGDLMLVGWSPWVDVPFSFAPERGAHGGFGPYETQGFALLPANTPLPEGTDHFIRPAALRKAAMYHLGREPLSTRRPGAVRGAAAWMDAFLRAALLA